MSNDAHSTLLSDDIPMLDPLCQELKHQGMESTLPPAEEPVSNAKVKPSLSREKGEKLPFVCVICHKAFFRKNVLKIHMKFHSGKKPFACDVCEKTFVQKGDLQRHATIHSKMYKCNHCSEVFSRKFELLKHEKGHKRPALCPTRRKILKSMKRGFNPNEMKSERIEDDSTPIQTGSSLNNVSLHRFKRHNILCETVFYSNMEKDLTMFLETTRLDILNELKYQLEEKKTQMKWFADVKVVLSRLEQDGDLKTNIQHLLSNSVLELCDNNLILHLENAFENIIDSLEKYTKCKSAWTLEKIVYMQLTTKKYTVNSKSL